MAKVMIIDDNPDIRLVIALNLEAEGYTVIQCSDGYAALEAVKTELPDVVVCDIMMPGLDGYGVLRELRGRQETSRVPLVFLSAKTSDKDIWDGWQAGADYYLTKPFDPDELITFLRYVSHEHSSVPEGE